MTTKSNRKSFVESEADAWFERNKVAVEAQDADQPIAMLVNWLLPFREKIGRIGEIGCGGGYRLHALCDGLSAKGTGIDPSPKAIAHARARFGHVAQFKVGTSEGTGWSAQEYDLVHLGFFLYLIDRQDCLATLAEADRLVRPGSFLSVLDFDPQVRHKRPYHHVSGLHSYKSDYGNILVSTGHYSLVHKFSFSHQDFHFTPDPDERIALSLLYKEPEPYPVLAGQ